MKSPNTCAHKKETVLTIYVKLVWLIKFSHIVLSLWFKGLEKLLLFGYRGGPFGCLYTFDLHMVTQSVLFELMT